MGLGCVSSRLETLFNPNIRTVVANAAGIRPRNYGWSAAGATASEATAGEVSLTLVAASVAALTSAA